MCWRADLRGDRAGIDYLLTGLIEWYCMHQQDRMILERVSYESGTKNNTSEF